ncbi:DNA mismatch repair protein MutS domain-containing protein [uncultured Mycobacterium sp.]|uniref:DNA mismatch repair protein MutS domain-containing protein n=1 Tax=uncultured Mycobacterium sp. TaxID=171292 RepID=A0A1Y5PLD6_9MYCO|nr:DNA mismatch repair protein MutS domain-containing protein [uncultured Mycobacterium sp.]
MATFSGIVFTRPPANGPTVPDCLPDLHLDQVIAVLAPSDVEESQRQLFYARARDIDEIAYRHEVFADLSSPPVRSVVDFFADQIAVVRRHLALAAKLWHPLQRQGWVLNAMRVYAESVTNLRSDLDGADLASRGLRRLREFIAEYVDGEEFQALRRDTKSVREALSQIRYTVHITGLHVDVDRFADQPDYTAQLTELFDRFRQDNGRDYHVRIPDYPDMNHVEEQVLDRVAKLYPEKFAALADHCVRYGEFFSPTLDRFQREIYFYLSYLDFMGRFTAAGLRFCYPTMTPRFSGVYAEEAFDLALATKQLSDQESPICNDFRLSGDERIIIVTGPNQGGKTTFARSIGQIFYLAALGCPVPAARAALLLPDQVYTHFERQEHISTLHGKLDDELVRIHDVLSRVTDRSIIVMNESFSSTTVDDAVQISTDVLYRVVDTGCACVYVSFLDELADLHPACVSMVGGVAADDPTVRTFRFTRRPADGLAYAEALADKYGLGREILRRRVIR